MCGFIGGVNFGGTAPSIPTETQARIRWRGPDEYREEQFGNACVLGSARLAIIDLTPEADQPLRSENGEWAVAYNGEIYNYKELAATHGLSAKAHRSDSWALVELISLIGVEATHRQLRGMYAFAAWESRSDRLWLVRDPFGVKPLALMQVGGTVLFGSDPRSLVQWGVALGQEPRLDPYALTHYLMLGYVPGDATMWLGVDRVQPGQIVVVESMGRTTREFPTWSTGVKENVGKEAEPTLDEVDYAVRSAVKRNLIADVEVGAFLSGGIDSSLIVALSRGGSAAQMRTYAVGFESTDVFDESPMAAEMAKSLGAKHTTIRLAPGDLPALLHSVSDAFPEPHGDAAAMPMMALSQRAAQDVKVVMTGEGGDEMFGGYRRYWAYPLVRSHLGSLGGAVVGRTAHWLGSRRLRQMASAATSSTHESYLQFLTQLHWSYLVPASAAADSSTVNRTLNRYDLPELVNPTPDGLRRLELDRHLPDTYLEKGDRSTMRNGLEARVPLLDLDIAEVAMRIRSNKLARSGKTKILFRQVAARHLPQSVMQRPKRGFSVPLAEWFATSGTSRWIRETLLDGAAVSTGVLDLLGLEFVIGSLATFAREENADCIYRLLALEFWCRSAQADGCLPRPTLSRALRMARV